MLWWFFYNAKNFEIWKELSSRVCNIFYDPCAWLRGEFIVSAWRRAMKREKETDVIPWALRPPTLWVWSRLLLHSRLLWYISIHTSALCSHAIFLPGPSASTAYLALRFQNGYVHDLENYTTKIFIIKYLTLKYETSQNHINF